MKSARMNSIKIRTISVCDKICLFSIYGIAFFLPISKGVISTFIYLGIASFLLRKILQRDGIDRSFINLTVIIYACVCFISIFLSTSPWISFRSFLGKVMQNIALFFLVADTINNEKKIRNAMYIFLVSASVLGVDGIYQHFTHKDFIRGRPDFEIPRIYATFGSPSDFGCYLTAMLPFSIMVFFARAKSKILHFLTLALTALLFVCLIFTTSRGAWLGFGSAVIFMGIWIFSLYHLVFLAGILAAVYCLQPSIRGGIEKFFTFTDISAVERRYMWEAAWKMFLTRPWLGVGFGTFMFNFRKFVSPSFAYIAYAHNCYLQMIAEIGIVGLGSFLLILGVFYFNGIKKLNRVKERSFTWYALLGCLSAVLGYTVQMGVETTFYSLDLGVLFWYLLGLGTASLKALSVKGV